MPTSQQRHHLPGFPSRGFTLAELLVVIVVIGVLAAIAIPVFLSQADKASDTALKSDLTNAAKLLQVAEANGETLPSEIAAGEVVDLGSAGTFTSNQTLTVSGAGESLCIEGVSDSGTTYSADARNGVRGYTCAGIPSGALITDGMFMHLDAADPASYPGSGTTWTDLTGNGNDGTLINGVGYNTSGNGSLTFDGTNDYVDIPETTLSKDSSSYSVWFTTGVDFTGNYGDRGIVLGSSRTMPGLAVVSQNGMDGETSNNHEFYINQRDTNVLPAGWVNVQTVFDNGVSRTYVNGSLIEPSPTSWSTGGSLSANLLPISKIVATRNDSNYEGEIGHVSFYDRPLSAAEVGQNFNALRERYGV